MDSYNLITRSFLYCVNNAYGKWVPISAQYGASSGA
jgi:hypothetical protein